MYVSILTLIEAQKWSVVGSLILIFYVHEKLWLSDCLRKNHCKRVYCGSCVSINLKFPILLHTV